MKRPALWNALLNLILGTAGLTAALYLADLMQGPNRTDDGAGIYQEGSSALSSGFFLLLGLLFLAAFISHRLIPSRFWPSIAIGLFLVLVYLFVGSWIIG